jgi:phosphatidate cytidylyltransferase
MTGPDPTTPDLRAAHRARHLAAAPEATVDFDDDDEAGWRPAPGTGPPSGSPGAAGGRGSSENRRSGEAQLAGEDWPAAGDPAGGWRLARELGDAYRPAPSVRPDLAGMRPAEASAEGALEPEFGARRTARAEVRAEPVRDHGARGEPVWGDEARFGPDATATPGGSGPPEPTPTATPPEPPPPAEQPVARSEPARRSRAGRNLPAAIGVGLGLGGLVLASLLLWKPAFYGVILVAVWIATWEMVRAVAHSGLKPPLVALLLGGTAILGVAGYGGAEALPYGLLGAVVAILVWRLADGPAGYQRDTVTALLIAAYVPFLGGFVVLLLAPGDGHLRVLAMLIGVVLSDTGGYALGVFFGRTKLAPSVSPGKTWEGLGGSVLTAAVGGALIVVLMFDDDWWKGVVFGVAVAIASTLGDLGESLLKRDLNVKDMSNLLPGHGGLMDRLDSILLAAPVSYTVLTLLVPPG